MLNSASSTSLPGPSCIPSPFSEPSKTHDPFSEAALVALAKAGDHDAFAEIYLRHKRRVFLICMRAVHDFSLAEDLTQETFLQLHRKIASFRGDSSFATWLHRMAVNTTLMYLRRRGLSLVSFDELVGESPKNGARQDFGTPDLVQAGSVDRLAIKRAVASLAPGYRAVFELHDLQGFQHGEIAVLLNCTSGSTKSQLHNARRILRRALDSQKRVPDSKHDDFDSLPMSA
jgi:RNA polymerase sigma-70 factor (ECF subfamily)